MSALPAAVISNMVTHNAGSVNTVHGIPHSRLKCSRVKESQTALERSSIVNWQSDNVTKFVTFTIDTGHFSPIMVHAGMQGVCMDVTFSDSELAVLEQDPSAKTRLDGSLVRAFRRMIDRIRCAADERDLREMKAYRFEKLKGDRDGDYSMRLNDQWRLTFRIIENQPKNTIHILAIEDYH